MACLGSFVYTLAVLFIVLVVSGNQWTVSVLDRDCIHGTSVRRPIDMHLRGREGPPGWIVSIIGEQLQPPLALCNIRPIAGSPSHILDSSVQHEIGMCDRFS